MASLDDTSVPSHTNTICLVILLMFFPTGSNMFNFLVVCFALSTPLVEGGDCEVGDSFCKGRFGNVYSCKTYQQSPTEVRYCNFINDWKTDAQCLCEDPHPHKDCKYGDDFCKDKYGITSRCELYGMYPEEIRKCKFVTWQVDSSCRCEKAPPTTPTPKPPACPNPKADDVCKENVSPSSECMPGRPGLYLGYCSGSGVQCPCYGW